MSADLNLPNLFPFCCTNQISPLPSTADAIATGKLEGVGISNSWKEKSADITVPAANKGRTVIIKRRYFEKEELDIKSPVKFYRIR
ncbi:MAG: hypothetical protein AAB275_02640 [Deltaproteobacteria bacterium]